MPEILLATDLKSQREEDLDTPKRFAEIKQIEACLKLIQWTVYINISQIPLWPENIAKLDYSRYMSFVKDSKHSNIIKLDYSRYMHIYYKNMTMMTVMSILSNLTWWVQLPWQVNYCDRLLAKTIWHSSFVLHHILRHEILKLMTLMMYLYRKLCISLVLDFKGYTLHT